MKLASLKISGFSTIADLSLELSTEPSRVHVIHGPNEAGKSTTLIALRTALFGKLTPEEDARLEDPEGRIELALVDAGGKVEPLIRQRRAKNWRLTTPGPERLSELCGPLLEKVYRQNFGLDHERLRAGGEDLARCRGDMAEALFSAAIGATALRTARDAVDERIARLFSAQATTREINQALAQLKQLKQQKNDLLQEEEKLRLDAEALRSEDERRAGTASRHRELASRRDRLTRFLDALEPVAERDDFRVRVEALGPLPGLSEDFHARFDTVHKEVAIAARREGELAAEVRRRTLEAAQAVVPEAVLAAAGRIDEVYRTLTLHRQRTEQELPALRSDLGVERDAIELALARVGLPAGPASAEQLSLDDATRLRIRELVSLLQESERQLRVAEETCVQRRTDAEVTAQKLAGLESAFDVLALEGAVEATSAAAGLEKRQQELRAALEKVAGSMKLELARCPAWSGEVEAFLALALPSEGTIERSEGEIRGNAEELHAAERRVKEIRKRIEGWHKDLRGLKSSGSLPAPDALDAARRTRDDGWRLVRRSWLERDPDEAAEATFQDLTGGADLASAFESAVHGADSVADQLCAAGENAGKRNHLLTQLQTDERELTQGLARVATLESTRDRVRGQWTALFAPLGFAQLEPAEMRAALEIRSKIAGLQNEMRQGELAVEACGEEIARARSVLDAGRQHSALPGLPGVALDALIARCQEDLKRLRAVVAARDALERDRERLKGELIKLEADSQRWREEAQGLERRWDEATAWLAPGKRLTPDEAVAYLTTLDDVLRRRTAAARLDVRIQEIRSAILEFEAEVSELVALAAPELDGTAAVRAQGLHARLTAARAAAAAREAAQQELKNAERDRTAVSAQLTAARVRMDTLCQEAGGARAEELPRIIDAVTRRAGLQDQLVRVEKQLRQLAGAEASEEFIAAARGRDRQELEAEIEGAGRELGHLQQELKAIDESNGVRKNNLERSGKDTTLTRLAEQIADQEHLVETLACEYSVCELARAVLERAIERYAQKHQGPVLSRASKAFATLTRGSFVDLQPVESATGRILQGVRPDGARVPPERMSDGARDQLYLALRIATIEDYCSRQDPVPVLLDDILVHFDDRRAAAAIEVLGELAQRTQVILFTHHQHVLDLCAEVLGNACVSFELAAGRGARPPPPARPAPRKKASR